MSRPRVLVVEDDASIRRFVQLALEDEPVELVLADGVISARQALSEPPFALVLTDLMLPDGHGADLLQALAEQPALRGPARLAVFSAGVTAAMRERLAALGVERILAKPAPLAALLDCVRWATTALPAAADAAPAAPPVVPVDAIAEFFAGDEGLYRAFRASCVAQFPLDVAAGDAAVARRDGQALRRLAHSLKTVLRSLGLPADGALAARIEDDAAAGRVDAANEGWARLRSRLPAS